MKSSLTEAAKFMRQMILSMSHLVGPERKAHPGAALSIVEILVYLFEEKMTATDKFVLSKGHGALALYAALARNGQVDESEFALIRSVRGRLQGHPVRGSVPGIDVTTGSLGHGLGLGVGIALAQKLRDDEGPRTYVVLGDGELQEGMVWESALIAANLKLSNLCVVIDNNLFQSSGRIADIAPIEPIADKFLAFGWSTASCDGHDFDGLRTAFDHNSKGRPLVIIASTIKGKGISFMEGNTWHQRYLSSDLLRQALNELDMP